jgi:hypothetical protein
MKIAEHGDLVERVAQTLYEKTRTEFHNDPATVSCGPDFADDVFPPWDEVENKERWYSDARSVVAIVLEEARKQAEYHQKRQVVLREECQSGWVDWQVYNQGVLVCGDIIAAINRIIRTQP